MNLDAGFPAVQPRRPTTLVAPVVAIDRNRLPIGPEPTTPPWAVTRRLKTPEGPGSPADARDSRRKAALRPSAQ
jgi:hypothetical protein